ncbi:MAG: hypothetical protein DRP90_07200, partial [Planctomycetota bacterium]
MPGFPRLRGRSRAPQLARGWACLYRRFPHGYDCCRLRRDDHHHRFHLTGAGAIPARGHRSAPRGSRRAGGGGLHPAPDGSGRRSAHAARAGVPGLGGLHQP